MKRWRRTIPVAVSCALIGAAAGIATGGAATHAQKSQGARHDGPRWFEGPGRFGGPPVHSDAVVLNQAGKAFETVTADSGTVKSLTGDQLTIAEATNGVPYKDAVVTVPASAKVMRNFSVAKLSDLQTGDRVHVMQAPERTVVFAVDAAHAQQRPRGFPGHGPERGQPDGPPPPGN